MNSTLNRQEQMLLELLKIALNPKNLERDLKAFHASWTPVEEDWKVLFELGKKHKVLSLLYDTLAYAYENDWLPECYEREMRTLAQITVAQSYRLLILTKQITDMLSNAGIAVVVLKGAAVAVDYPVPELRKSGDVDLLVADPNEFRKAVELFRQHGFKENEDQLALHHIAFETKDHIEIELHSMLAEPFDSQRTNQYLQEQQKNYSIVAKKTCLLGIELPVARDPYHAYYLLLHMLQHFLRAGFGLKLICDWKAVWENGMSVTDRDTVIRMTKESGIYGFTRIITGVCTSYLGLDRSCVSGFLEPELPIEEVDLFLQEVLESGEFGKSEKNRMVALRGGTLKDYLREFHHQMCLNHPKYSKYQCLWPGLWILTLTVFLKNNLFLRKTSTREILKKAGQRGNVIAKMKLFQ